MTLDDDDWHAMTPLSPQLRSSRNRDLDALGDGGRAVGKDLQPVAAFLAQLRGLADRPAPRPSAELASVLTHGFAPQTAPSVARSASRPAGAGWWRRGALAFGLSAGLSAALVGAAAASDRLPEGAHDVLERMVEKVTPFDIGDQESASPAGEDRGPQTPLVGDEPIVPLTGPHNDNSQDRPERATSATVDMRSEGEDRRAQKREDESGHRNLDSSGTENDEEATSGDGRGVDHEEAPAGNGEGADPEGVTVGEGEGADHELASVGSPGSVGENSDADAETSPVEEFDPAATGEASE